MATGPEHYREAERLLVEADDKALGVQQQRNLLTAAQAHATLALTAATAEPIAQAYDGPGDTAIPAAWSEAIS